MNRIVLPKCATDMVASALSYTAVVAALQQEPSELRRKFMKTNGAINFNCHYSFHVASSKYAVKYCILLPFILKVCLALDTDCCV